MQGKLVKVELSNGMNPQPEEMGSGNILTQVTLIGEMVTTPAGNFLYALPRDKVPWDNSTDQPNAWQYEAGQPGHPIPDGEPATLQQAGHDVLTKRNEELTARNAALEHINKKLEEQNRELMDRLMRITDTVMEKLYGEEQTPSGGRGRSTKKKPGAGKPAEGSNGAEA